MIQVFVHEGMNPLFHEQYRIVCLIRMEFCRRRTLKRDYGLTLGRYYTYNNLKFKLHMICSSYNNIKLTHDVIGIKVEISKIFSNFTAGFSFII